MQYFDWVWDHFVLSLRSHTQCIKPPLTGSKQGRCGIVLALRFRLLYTIYSYKYKL